jgi:hypothetical protein
LTHGPRQVDVDGCDHGLVDWRGERKRTRSKDQRRWAIRSAIANLLFKQESVLLPGRGRRRLRGLGCFREATDRASSHPVRGPLVPVFLSIPQQRDFLWRIIEAADECYNAGVVRIGSRAEGKKLIVPNPAKKEKIALWLDPITN